MEPEGKPKELETNQDVETTETTIESDVVDMSSPTSEPAVTPPAAAVDVEKQTEQHDFQGQGEQEQQAIQHDSMVTVRLSEPSPPPQPALRVDTNVPPSILPTRRSSTMMEKLGQVEAEEDDTIVISSRAASADAEDDSPDGTTASASVSRPDSIAAEQMSPIVIEAPMSLRQELEDSDGQDDDDGMQTPGEESSDDDDEAPDWARLQETEDSEAKDRGKDVDNVSAWLL